MSDPLASIDGTLDVVWDALARGAADRDAPARHPVLATVGPAGAEARIVVLRAADRAKARVAIHTDLRSGKVAQLRSDPRASLLVWLPDATLQIRLRVRFALLTGRDADRFWGALPEAARALYGGMPPPGRPVARPEDHAPGQDPDAFCVLDGRVSEIETLKLDATRHRRALFRATDNWRGGWRAP